MNHLVISTFKDIDFSACESETKMQIDDNLDNESCLLKGYVISFEEVSALVVGDM